MTFESQFDIFRQFCQSIRARVYKCDELKMELFLDKDIRVKYKSLWNDVVSIRMNLLNGKFRQLFENRLNVSKNKLNQFYKYFGCNRRFCVKLPINGIPKLNDFNMWVEMIEKFDGGHINATRSRREVEMFDVGNLKHIYTFIVLWNGIFSMMHKRDENYMYGLVSAIKKMKFNGCVIY